MSSPFTLSEIESDISDGISLGVDRIPYYFINDSQIPGDQTFSVFIETIEAELRESTTTN